MYFESKGKAEVTYDAIVVGSGISGGWAAKELSEKGLKTLMLERGRKVAHGEYPTANQESWEVPNRGKTSAEEIRKHYSKQNRTGYTISEFTKHWWIRDSDQPYGEDKPFDWIRGYHLGGRSLLWGRQSYRWSPMDFEANGKEGVAVEWPIGYEDVAPWYDYVEQFAGISGQNEGLKQLPDGKLLPPMEYNCLEEKVKTKMAENFSDRMMTIGRTAHLTVAKHNRGTCQFRNRCIRGCPFGAYFSSLASTLPAAEVTGNLTTVTNAIVTSVIFDDKTQKATGVRVKDANTLEEKEFFAKVIFLNASTVGTTSILMHSTSERFADGMGNDSGELGHNLMDHHFKVGARGDTDEFRDKYTKGRRPNGIYIPRFRNLDAKTKQKDFLRGYGYQGGAGRNGWQKNVKEMTYGESFKEALTQPGDWSFGINGFGEMLPYHENKMYLNYDVKDKWGLHTVNFDVEIKENELEMRKDMKQSAVDICEAAGLKNVTPYERVYNPGNGIHEMGTARMGKDPKTSVLNKWNQIHAVKNVFVTDGSCMTSAACQNPSLTYMALTARAADYAVKELKKQNL